MASISGACHIYVALDLGFAVDIRRCISLIAEAKERSAFRHNRKAPVHFDYDPRPAVLTQQAEPITIGRFKTEATVTMTIFDFAAASILYTLPLEGELSELVALSDQLYDNQAIMADARRRAAGLLNEIKSAVVRPELGDAAEEYMVFEIHNSRPEGELEEFIAEHSLELAQILSSDTSRLSDDQVREELSAQISHYGDDLSIITWNAALLFGRELDDVRAVLEFANVQLLELVHLDYRLDHDLDEVYGKQTDRITVTASTSRIGELMIDAQFFNEAVTNALKLLGDPFLARVYALAARRFGLPHWDENIKGKLGVLNSIYTTLADRAEHRRSNRLEIIVILLIAVEIVLYLIQDFF